MIQFIEPVALLVQDVDVVVGSTLHMDICGNGNRDGYAVRRVLRSGVALVRVSVGSDGDVNHGSHAGRYHIIGVSDIGSLEETAPEIGVEHGTGINPDQIRDDVVGLPVNWVSGYVLIPGTVGWEGLIAQ
jgi:hypothetical protein